MIGTDLRRPRRGPVKRRELNEDVNVSINPRISTKCLFCLRISRPGSIRGLVLVILILSPTSMIRRTLGTLRLLLANGVFVLSRRRCRSELTEVTRKLRDEAVLFQCFAKYRCVVRSLILNVEYSGLRVHTWHSKGLDLPDDIIVLRFYSESDVQN